MRNVIVVLTCGFTAFLLVGTRMTFRHRGDGLIGDHVLDEPQVTAGSTRTLSGQVPVRLQLDQGSTDLPLTATTLLG